MHGKCISYVYMHGKYIYYVYMHMHGKEEKIQMYKYGIDGKSRIETESERLDRESTLGGRLHLSQQQEIQRAKSSLLGTHQQVDNPYRIDKRASDALPWNRQVDRILFGKDGEAQFHRNDAKFKEFQEFYTKYKNLSMQKIPHPTPNEEIELARNALVLFTDFLEKKREKMRIKIDKDRNGLPIKAKQQEIVQMVQKNQVVLIAADTGAGKSTQVPQYLLSAGFEKIACTQPRRIACYSLAKRVSYESLDEYGSEIAYKVRFDGNRTDKTRILFLTEGVLLRQYHSDALLSTYNVIIVDEVHERHITGDFLLGVLKKLIKDRKDIRIVLMSATINATLFSKYFDAPIIEVPGRMYPVKIEYHPFEKQDLNLTDPKLYQKRMESNIQHSVTVKSDGGIKVGPYLKIMEKIDQSVPPTERGDLLIFLSGMYEISTLAEELKAYANYTKKWIILLLHSSLSVAEQERVFDIAPQGIRKCILSTNLAETSVTIDGIRFIIDSGRVKEMTFDPMSGLSRLSEFWLSQSSAKQRAGRAGRTGPGECYRLYSKVEYDHLNAFPVPEIQRTCLDPLLIQIKAYGLGNPREFDFIERPMEESIEKSIYRLQDLGAFDEKENLSRLGNALALLPIDVVLGKMLILGSVCDILEPVLVIAAALSVPCPFAKIADSQSHILDNRKQLFSEHGDPFTLLNVYSEWLRVKAEGGSSSKWCTRHGIEEQRLYEMVKLKEQFHSILKNFLSNQEDLQDGIEEYEGTNSKKRSRDVDSESQYWTNPEYKRKREQKRLLYQQKQLQSSSKRKILKFTEIEHDSQEEAGQPSIDELEFSLKHNAQELLGKSDVNVLMSKDINLIKLVLCSGLYPHIALADESNYARKLSEQAFHTNSKKFLSMHPTSVYAYRPEIVQPRPPEDSNSLERLRRDVSDLSDLHEQPRNREVLCYLSLLETNKPYLTNVFRVQGLQACLLFARSICISSDMTHYIVDNWLHLHIQDPSKAQQMLILSNWLRYAWSFVIEKKLELQDSHQALFQSAPQIKQTLGPSLKRLPPSLQRIAREWASIVNGDIKDLDAVDISLRLSEFVDMKLENNIEKAKSSDLMSLFGTESLDESHDAFSIQVTPNLWYYPSNDDKFTVSPLMTVEIDSSHLILQQSIEEREVQSNTLNENPPKDNRTRSHYECQTCSKTFLFTPIETLKHGKTCKNL